MPAACFRPARAREGRCRGRGREGVRAGGGGGARRRGLGGQLQFAGTPRTAARAVRPPSLPPERAPYFLASRWRRGPASLVASQASRNKSAQAGAVCVIEAGVGTALQCGRVLRQCIALGSAPGHATGGEHAVLPIIPPPQSSRLTRRRARGQRRHSAQERQAELCCAHSARLGGGRARRRGPSLGQQHCRQARGLLDAA